MKKHEFPFKLNPSTDLLDEKILRWAWEKKLVADVEELERLRTQKINSFAGFLFPEANEDKLQVSMKLFLCLFLLDDLLDVEYGKHQVEFLDSLMVPGQSTFDLESRLGRLGFEISLLGLQLEQQAPCLTGGQSWREVWQFYMEGLQWETINRSLKNTPSITEYQMMRPHSSGVFLAIHLLKPRQVLEECDTQLLELTIARFICLSNDLASWVKELEMNDRHNELLLLRSFYGEKADAMVNQELDMLKKKIFYLSELLSLKSEECRQWVDSLLYLVGGCMAWSNMTFRYTSGINGKSRYLE
ncbi:terpene synthase family protein [Algoriphagus sp. AK58]|uniref:terpene synthase family protein n=1 Tax=Algoriphagus sp. AK58 TaxID=1406877 RepID=UPI0016502CC0|nr:terpene synthase family protein [Algoriphagus sp. AK58]MBC6365753.1 hypothetical protein [Algoriphagus sp. AK58]